MRILMISSEVETFARTGGLGDAVYGLSRALARLGHDVCVVTPLYGMTPIPEHHHFWTSSIPVRVGWGSRDERQCGVCEVRDSSVTKNGGTLRFCLLANDALFGSRRGIYGDDSGTFGDNELRFATMSRGALEIAARLWPDGVDVIHAHDWHAALGIVYARAAMGDAWARVRSIFTVHNLAYQGVLAFEALDRLGVPRGLFHGMCLEQDGNVNLLKGAVALCDVVTTVSPTYSREIQRRGNGFYLEWFFRMHARKLVGITNGIDEERFDPTTEPRIAERFDSESVWKGKWTCKQALVSEMDLGWADAPLFACVSRLTEQKGIDLLYDSLGALDRSRRARRARRQRRRAARGHAPPRFAAFSGSRRHAHRVRRCARDARLRGRRLHRRAVALRAVRPHADVRDALRRDPRRHRRRRSARHRRAREPRPRHGHGVRRVLAERRRLARLVRGRAVGVPRSRRVHRAPPARDAARPLLGHER